MQERSNALMVLRPPAIDAMISTSGDSECFLISCIMKSAARRLSSADLRSHISFLLASGITWIDIGPKTSLPSMQILSFLNAERSLIQTGLLPSSKSHFILSTEFLADNTTISSGTIGFFKCANAQTVSVNTAGDAPIVAISTIRLSFACLFIRSPYGRNLTSITFRFLDSYNNRVCRNLFI